MQEQEDNHHTNHRLNILLCIAQHKNSTVQIKTAGNKQEGMLKG